MNEILTRMFSQTRTQFGGGIQEGILTEAGNFGMNPLAARKVLQDGNLRERMYIPYKTLAGFAGELFQDAGKLDRINAILERDGVAWRVDTRMVEEIAKGNQKPYDYGVYASRTKADNLRTNRSLQERERVAERQNLRIDDPQRSIKLSHREKLLGTGELSPDKTRLSTDLQGAYAHRAKEKSKWQSGTAWFTAPSSEQNPHDYVIHQENLALPAISGISGTTDQFMTTALLLGLNSRQDLELLRLALLGWLIEAKDHSYHEVMMSSRTFGLDYHPSPESYKEVYPADREFAKKVENTQRAKGQPMPAECLKEEYVRSKIKAA